MENFWEENWEWLLPTGVLVVVISAILLPKLVSWLAFADYEREKEAATKRVVDNIPYGR